jgi:hypothetical protein
MQDNKESQVMRDDNEPAPVLQWKPLQTFLPKLSPRGQPIEQRTFKTCTSKLNEFKYFRY